MGEAISKRCNRCNEVDVTDFSTCKSCGQRYDVAKYKAPASNGPVIFLIVLISVGTGVWFSRDALSKLVTSSLSGNQGKASMLGDTATKK